MPLHKENKNLLRKELDRAHVETTLASVKPFLANQRWLGKSNRYLGDVVKKLADDERKGKLNRRNVSQYIAISALLHNIDGWSYLGRALSSAMHGDAYAAGHLAYYAELRGAMSLLASEGVGVFKNRHYLVNADASVKRFPKTSGTHEFVWDALEHWGKQGASSDLISRLVRPQSVELLDWLHPVGGGAVLRPTARDWLKQWGMDIARLSKDRDARNEISYRPTGLKQSISLKPRQAYDFVQASWGVFEPGSSSSFGEIDAHLLRLSVEQAYVGKTGNPPTHVGFASFVDVIVNGNGFGAAEANRWKLFLRRETAADDPLLLKLAGIKPNGSAASCLGVIARSLLMLRLSCGAVDRLFAASGIAGRELDFWRFSFGAERGFWSSDGPPDPIGDLWLDVDEALHDLRGELGNLRGDGFLSDLLGGLGASLHTLGGWERVPLWSIRPRT